MIISNNGTNSFATFSQSNGNYQIPVNEGDFTTTTTSILPNYLSMNPNSHSSNFVGLGNTDTANFCLEPTSSVNDLSISIYPSINEPRPGFDTTYRIVYKNTGTMQLESLSHSGSVEITDGNMVKFLFNNINLPDSTSDEPNSHGFITYKIKPKSTVAIGDIVYNTADIFFDFNPPITTNTVATEIAETLSVNEFTDKGFSIYPNPTKDIVNINGKENINKLSIHDLNGRLLKEIKLPNSKTATEIAMNEYAIGLYFLSIETDKEIYTDKIIKK